MAGSGDEMAAGPGGRGHLRASHADREQAIATLKTAFVQGMLTKDELDLRVGETFASRTYAELAAVTADLPAGLAAARPPQPGRVLTVATLLYAAAWRLAFAFPGSGPDHDSHAPITLVGWSTFIYLIVLLFAGAQILADRQDKRSGRPPRRRAVDSAGPPSPGLPPVSPGRVIPPADPGHRHTADAAPIGRRRLLPS
jgi:Domain of unknown function (DUF1707)